MKTIIIDENFKGVKKINDYYFEYSKDFNSNYNLEIKINLIFKGNLNCKGYLNCKGDLYCEGNLYCKGDLKIKEFLTKKYLRLYGNIPYRIIITDNHIQIGCQLKTKKEWSNITKNQAISMGDKELIIYKMKNFLLNI